MAPEPVAPPPIEDPVIEEPVQEEEVPPEEEPEPVMLDKFFEYVSLNDEIIGWLNMPGTEINYPVVYSGDNEFYLTHDYLKNPDKNGAIFMTPEGNILTANQSISLFGHDRKNGKMLAPMQQYKELYFYKLWPTFQFDTLYEEGTYKIFSVFFMAGDSKDSLFYYYPVSSFSSDERYQHHLDQLTSRSIYDLPVDVTVDDRIVIVSCCTYETDDLRIGVAGRLLREGETAEVDVYAAKAAENPLYPQKWYDKFGGTPPDIPGITDKWTGS